MKFIDRYVNRPMRILAGIVLAVTLIAVAIPKAQTGLYNSYGFLLTGKMLLSDTAPTVTSAGTSPSVTVGNGSATFIVNVGGGGAASAIVMAMPTASNGWTCVPNNITAAAANIANQADRQTASTTTSVTVQHFTPSTGAALVYTASDLVRFVCQAY